MSTSVIFSVFYSRLSFDGFLVQLYCYRIKCYGDDFMILGRSSSSYASAAHVEEVLLFDSVFDCSIVVRDDRP